MATFSQVFMIVYLPWILFGVTAFTGIIFALLAPREIWTAWRIKNTPGLVGVTLFDDSGQGLLKAVRNVADKGVFVTNKDEYVIVATSPPVEDEVPQYQYSFKPEWSEEERERHKEAVDKLNRRLREEAEVKRIISEVVKKRHILYGKPHYLGLLTASMGASPDTVGLMQDAVEGVEYRDSKYVKLIDVDVWKQVLPKVYPPSRLESITKRHENRVRGKTAVQIPSALIIVIMIIAAILILGMTGIVDFGALGSSILGVAHP